MRASAGSGVSPSRSMTGKVFVEKPDILDDLIDSVGDRSFSKRGVHANSSRTVKAGSGLSEHSRLLKEQETQKSHQTELMMKLNIQKSLDVKKEKEHKLFPVLMSNLDKATVFLDTIDKDIHLHDETHQNKVRRQFEDWNTTVHGKIQKRIANAVNTMDSKALNKKKNEDYEKFLTITNRKPAIFRDIIIESEYDPLEPNKHCIKAKTGFLKDPVKIDAQKAAAEGAMLGPGAATGPKHKQLCKETLDVQLWASGQIEATPYGTFARIMNKSRGAEGTKSATMRSSVAFDHFDFPRGKAAIDREMPRGKRIHPVTIYANPAKVFHAAVPRHFEQSLAQIQPPENVTYMDLS